MVPSIFLIAGESTEHNLKHLCITVLAQYALWKLIIEVLFEVWQNLFHVIVHQEVSDSLVQCHLVFFFL